MNQWTVVINAIWATKSIWAESVVTCVLAGDGTPTSDLPPSLCEQPADTGKTIVSSGAGEAVCMLTKLGTCCKLRVLLSSLPVTASGKRTRHTSDEADG